MVNHLNGYTYLMPILILYKPNIVVSNNDRWEGISYIDSYKYDKNNTSNKLEVSWNGISSSGDWKYDERGGHVKVYTKVSGIAGQVILEQWESNKSLVISCHT